jgi:hypothetical protein
MSKKPVRQQRDEEDLSFIQDVLEGAGLRVERIPVAAERRCDLRATDDSSQYLIEVKGFHDDESIRPILREGGAYLGRRPTLHSAHVDKAIDEAVEQMDETPGSCGSDVRVVALIDRTIYGASVTASQIRGTLFGTRQIMDLGGTRGNTATDCLYFAESAFFRHKTLAGAIVIEGDGSSYLCLNDFAINRESARTSRLFQHFARLGGLNESVRLEQEAGLFVADCAFDRKDEKAVLAYLGQKYGLKRPISIHLTEHSAMSSVPRQPRA